MRYTPPETETLCLEIAEKIRQAQAVKDYGWVLTEPVEAELAREMPKAWAGFKQRMEWSERLKDLSIMILGEGGKPILASDTVVGLKYKLAVMHREEADKIRKKLRKKRERELAQARRKRIAPPMTKAQEAKYIEDMDNKAFSLLHEEEKKQ